MFLLILACNWTFQSAHTCWIDSTMNSKMSFSSCKFFFASSNIYDVSSWKWLKHCQWDKVSLSRHPPAWCHHKHLLHFGIFFILSSSFSSDYKSPENLIVITWLTSLMSNLSLPWFYFLVLLDSLLLLELLLSSSNFWISLVGYV